MTVSATGITGIAPAAPVAHGLDHRGEQVGRGERSRRVVDRDHVDLVVERRERGAHGGLPGRASGTTTYGLAQELHAPRGPVLQPAGAVTTSSVTAGDGRGGGGRHGEDRPIADRHEGLRGRRRPSRRPAPAASTIGRGARDAGMRDAMAPSMADRRSSGVRCRLGSGLDAGSRTPSAANTIRPVVVWITLVTRISTVVPMCSVRAFSTTTIVPSSR